jgi:hypothetical protein
MNGFKGGESFMSNKKKLTISKGTEPAVSIKRSVLEAEKLVYLAVANKSVKYHNGKSRIVYIGTTASGADRIASSAAIKARALLGIHGVSQLQFFIVTCTSRQKVKTWKKLESALILTFKAMYGDPPMGNIQGKKKNWSDEQEYFAYPRLESVVMHYS